jgi:hypothetical protein
VSFSNGLFDTVNFNLNEFHARGPLNNNLLDLDCRIANPTTNKSELKTVQLLKTLLNMLELNFLGLKEVNLVVFHVRGPLLNLGLSSYKSNCSITNPTSDKGKLQFA